MRLLDLATKNLAHSANATKLCVKRYPPYYRSYVASLREKKSLPDFHTGAARKQKEGLTQRRNVESKRLWAANRCPAEPGL